MPDFYATHKHKTKEFVMLKQRVISNFRVIHCISIMSMLTLLSACTSIPNPEKLPPEKFEQIDTSLPNQVTENIKVEEVDYIDTNAIRWWEGFNDPQLNVLVETALANSTDIRLAVERLNAAKASFRSSGADRLPSVNLSGSAGTTSADIEDSDFRSRRGRGHNASAALTMQWQTDLFGNLRNIDKARKAEFYSEEARLHDTKRIIVRGIVDTYFQLLTIRRQKQLAEDTEVRRKDNLERINKLLKRGYSTKLQKAQTDAQYYESITNKYTLKRDEINTINTLATETGVNLVKIREILSNTSALPTPPQTLQLPSVKQLLKHRPDLRRLERTLVARAYELKASEVNRFPTLDISASLSKDDGTLTTPINQGDFPNLNTLGANLVANLTMPILGRGRILAAIDRDSARLQQAYIEFEDGVRTAVQQIDTSIASIDINHHIYQQQKLATEATQTAEKNARAVFDAGEGTYTEVIRTERDRALQENNEVRSQFELLQAYIRYTADVVPAW